MTLLSDVVIVIVKAEKNLSLTEAFCASCKEIMHYGLPNILWIMSQILHMKVSCIISSVALEELCHV